jgi:hypothetical protein
MFFLMQSVLKNSATIAPYWTSVTLRPPELDHLLLNLTAVANQLARYKLTVSDVSPYVQSAVGASAFVPPTESGCLYV